MSDDARAERARHVEDLFAAALERSPPEREAFIEDACAGDAGLRAELASLLGAHRVASDAGYLEASASRVIGPYRLLERIGSGGMGVVWRARDTRLRRDVALKFLPWHLGVSSTDARERFLVEARAAAALDHPNICAVHDVGENENGELYIAMTFHDGETLARRLERGPLPIADSLDISTCVLAALAHAHSRGIVHRDVKPANIMVNADGVVKLLDFGIAKLTDVSLTATGARLGTPAYMSPEQIAGDAVDHRVDLWSTGVVLYQMVTGERPFEGPDRDTVLRAILTDAPRSLADHGLDPPADLQRILDRSLAKSNSDRYATADRMRDDIDALLVQLGEGDAANVAGVTRSRVSARRTPTPVPAAAARDDAAGGRHPRRSSRSAGGVRTRRGRIAIYVGLVLAVAIAARVAWSSARSTQTTATRMSGSARANDAYTRGLFYMNERGGGESQEDTAIVFLRQAVEADSGFALAWAALGRAYNLKQFGGVADATDVEYRDLAWIAIQRAMSLDSTLAEAHAAYGDLIWTLSYRFPHARAAAEYRRAIALEPGLAWPHQSLGSLYTHVGLLDEALAQFDTALAIDPGRPDVRSRIPRVHLFQGEYRRALDGFNAVPELEASWEVAIALLYLGRVPNALAHIERLERALPRRSDIASAFALVLAVAGRRDEALARIREAIGIGEGNSHFHHAAYNIASTYALLGDNAAALEWLHRTAEEGMPCYPLFRDDPHLDGLRGDAAFESFIARVKEQWDTFRMTL